MDIQNITTEEAIRRIQERDHVLKPGMPRMGFKYEQGMIELLREGVIEAALTEDGQLAFRLK